MKSRLVQFTAVAIILFGLTACGASKNISSETKTKHDIAWLAVSLQDEGVYIRERGSPNLNVPAFESTRMLLNDRDVLDVFEFEYPLDASSNAFTLASMNPGRDVYRKESLVVVRYSSRDTGLSQTLFKLLGGTL